MSVLTINDIALAVGKSQQALAKNVDVAKFQIGIRSNGGRPAKLYHPDVLSLFKSNDTGEVERRRKRRSDIGSARGGRSMQAIEYLTRLAFTQYMSCATPDVRSACRRAIRQAYQEIEAGNSPLTADEVEACERSEWLYCNWVNRSCATFRGPALTQGWALAHQERWRQWNAATRSGSNRYTFWKIAENDLGAGQGRGRGRFVMLDDRKTDVWTRTELGGFAMTYAVYAWDVLTGELLWVEQAQGDAVSGNDYVRCILGVLYRVGNDCPVWFMENSRAAKAVPVRGALDAIYTHEQKAWFENTDIKALFKGQGPVVRNTPHIPKDLGKAIGERLFGEVKRWDAMLYPESYHGAGIHEAVQLSRSVMPARGEHTPTVQEYFHNLLGEPYQAYLDQPRSILKEWAKKHNSEPTRRAMIEFYAPSAIQYPTADQTALLLYHAVTERHVVKLREWGQLDCRINNRDYRLRADELYSPDIFKRKLTVIPVPGRSDECAIYDTKNDLRFVCIARDFTGTTARNAVEIRVEGRKMREQARERVRDFTEKNLLSDPLKLADSRRKPVPELPPAQAEDEVIYSEVIDESADDAVLDNIHNLF